MKWETGNPRNVMGCSKNENVFLILNKEDELEEVKKA